MLIHSIKVELTSPLAAETVRERLRHRANEWRESSLSPAARAEGLVGWRLRERADHFVLRASSGGRNGFVPHFVGTVLGNTSGSTMVGELRLSWVARVFAVAWLTALAVGPFIALFGAPQEASMGEHVFNAAVIVVPCGLLFMAGCWLISYSSAGAILAFHQLLGEVTESTPASSSRETSAVGV